MLAEDPVDANFNPRPPRGERPSNHARRVQPHRISIHALREGGDTIISSALTESCGFQSTPSARRATHGCLDGVLPPGHFNPRPPRGGRPAAWSARPECRSISIHALREEGDLLTAVACHGPLNISIHALREEGDGQHERKLVRKADISIHALREEGDRPASRQSPCNLNFNPRPPRGGRPPITITLPTTRCYFNPRPPRGERPFKVALYVYADLYFNPRPPRGERL